jgi:stage V sporulation protein AC
MNPKQQKKNKQYQDYVKKKSPSSNLLKNSIYAFLVGGSICAVGQLIVNLGMNYYELDKDKASIVSAMVMIFLGSLLTGLGVYDDLGKIGGAGSIVPITGFANSIVSPAMEAKREGYIFGVGAKLFSIAGPVLVYGISASVAIGLVYHFFVK